MFPLIPMPPLNSISLRAESAEVLGNIKALL